MGTIVIMTYSVVALMPSVIAPFSAIEQHPEDRLQPPSANYRLGTDEFGRDILSRVLYGTRNTLTIAGASIGVAVFFGTILGMAAGYMGGLLDNVIMRAMDLLFAFPSLLLALFIAGILGVGFWNTIMAITIVYLPIFVRITRGPVLALKEREFIQAEVLLGASHFRILLRHILPNTMSTIIVTTSLALSWGILTESGLSFLGLGTVPPDPSWGSMLNDSRTLVELAPWTAVFPGVAILGCVIGFNLLGDGLQDVLNPQREA
jgi:peptide/nickel transport system permease protein